MTHRDPDNAKTDWQLSRPETATEEHCAALLKRVDWFLEMKNWREGYFSKLAAGDVGVVRRLRETGRITVFNLNQLDLFMSANGELTGETASSDRGASK